MSELINDLIELKQSEEYPFHMPGHKRNMPESYLRQAYNIDITEIEGYDNLYEADGILKEAQEYAANVFGADKTKFLVNGSTVGILSAIAGCVTKGDHVLMARNCHKAVYHAVELWELHPVYLFPPLMEEWDIAGGICPQEVETKLGQFPDIKAVIITSPTYEGIPSDIEKIARIVHKKGIPLIVDEAHGAHFSFHPRFPQSAIYKGADVVVQSLHKTLPSFTQTALLHLRKGIVSFSEIEKYLSYYQTSSPSYLFMAGMDECIHLLHDKGSTLWDDFFIIRDEFYENTSKMKHIRIYPTKTGEDPCKIIISVKGSNITGRELQKILLEKYHIQMEMASKTYVLAIATMNDTREGFKRLAKALKQIDCELTASNFLPECVTIKDTNAFCKISEVRAMHKEKILLKDAMKRVAADYVNVYPPGIPILAPGEIITEEIIEEIQRCCSAGLSVQGIENEMLQVIDDVTIS
ncbi:MAG: aminotransferase class I/II-fold pyridoxal phosphate-dependent enzyme [Lachnospiraceae bacterium]|nr:aminotransferase class I/II-fold pyridoxal phosphate-dependent enzyme [Lachnospiraceae bacterium]